MSNVTLSNCTVIGFVAEPLVAPCMLTEPFATGPVLRKRRFCSRMFLKFGVRVPAVVL